ncbi:glycoside hydrolase family 5 protein [Nocardioides daeguensis]|uniref:glycoside hydrolase family 5 protein n=1 Tax=Nocardioides daeguensis TaxID=908359 RepID=UPI001C464BF6|nr:cellulase family glycosylhydrolase [Nocardioides daeguensis]MBV6728443.1 cellulase family glycosylhydrolase [Nocardioides daeguensis]MCR1773867.1 cellulase family glycosylhydrolase [Nocardioides daeguensis]
MLPGTGSTRSRRWPLTLVAALLALGGLVGLVAAAPGAAADDDGPPQLRREGRWLVDEQGRVVIVHGFNLVWKLDPYVPPDSVEGFRAADARWLAEHGFNGVRLGTMWAGITPDAAGVGDPSYRARWQRVMDLLAERGIWMQLDMHQDQWHETYGGEGVPDWALHRPAVLGLLPAVNLPFPLGYWTPENSLVFDQFWANRWGGIDDWAAAWQVAAGWWKDQPRLMGYDLINEPWMGLEWLSCFTGGCAGAYQRELQPAYEKVTRAIRQVDPDNVVWWEPQQLAAGRPVPTYLRPMAGETQLGYSWHNYCQDVFLESQGLPVGDVENCWKFSRERTTTALAQAATMQAAPLMSEWGATDNPRAVEIDAAVADEHLMGWTHWAYKQWRDPTTADDAQGLFRDDADFGSVKQDKLRLLVRTYAQATAGTPLQMRFDPDSGAFAYRYRSNGLSAPTEIFVSPLHYPHGYDVAVDGGRWAPGTAGRIEVRPDVPGQEVTVTITAR